MIANPSQRRLFYWAVGVCAILFWGLRVYYWTSVTELPFSDMGNFEEVSHRVATSWDFSWSSTWKAYSTPTLFVLRALVLKIFGEPLIFWEFFQTILLWFALLWLAYESMKQTKQPWLAVALLAVVAISKPSIFWSLKLSRESIHEMFSYATAASFLYLLRRDKWWCYVLFGAILMANTLNRPNSLLILPLALIAFVAHDYYQSGKRSEKRGANTYWCLTTVTHLTKVALLITLGLALLWGPWIVRNYRIYGELVPLSTQAPYTLLWDLGRIEVQLQDGTHVVTDVNELQAEANTKFTSDLEASKYANQIAKAWLKEHWQEMPHHIGRRLKSSIMIDVEYLSKVSRTNLYNNWVDRFLLVDKSYYAVLMGCVGLILLPVIYQASMTIVPIVAIVPWLTGAAMVGYPRMLDPSLPLILFGNVILLMVIGRRLIRKN